MDDRLEVSEAVNETESSSATSFQSNTEECSNEVITNTISTSQSYTQISSTSRVEIVKETVGSVSDIRAKFSAGSRSDSSGSEKRADVINEISKSRFSQIFTDI